MALMSQAPNGGDHIAFYYLDGVHTDAQAHESAKLIRPAGVSDHNFYVVRAYTMGGIQYLSEVRVS